MPTTVSFYIIGFLAVFLIGLGKGGFGGGASMAGTLLLGLESSLLQSIGIILPILCAVDLFTLFAYRKTPPDQASMRILLPGMLIGFGIGVFFLRYLNDQLFTLLLGVVTLFFAVDTARRMITRRVGSHHPHNRPAGLLLSILSGLGSTVAHAGGPPIDYYLIPRQLPKKTYVATLIRLFAVINIAKLIPFLFLGIIDRQNVAYSLLFLVAAPAGIAAGRILNRVLAPRLFYAVCTFFLLAMGLRLLVSAV